jgi:hypothetical protein
MDALKLHFSKIKAEILNSIADRSSTTQDKNE